MTFRLRDANATLRLFLTTFLVVLSLGYAVGLFFVEHTTAFTLQGVQEQFLGNESSPGAHELRYAKSAHEMFVFIHNHVLSLSVVFFILGGMFFFSSLVSERLKRFLMVEPLLALVTTFGGMALVRYVSPAWSWLVVLSGASLALCYCVMVGLMLFELWMRPKE
jgi:hypothetical protein